VSLEIDQALVTAFLAGSFGIGVAHENRDYKPENDPYAEIIVLQNDTTPFSLAHSDETDGVFRVILRYPAGSGAITPKTKAEEIRQHFKIGTRLTYGGASLTIKGHQRQPGVQEQGWYKLIINLPYRATLTR
jgi:hypothetical protein